MAINVADWSHKLFIPDDYIPGSSLLGVPLLITHDVIANLVDSDDNPAADIFWNNVQNGGGDIRCCANEDGTGQYPVDVPGDNINTTTETGHWFVYRPYSGAGGVWVFFGKAGETQPLVTDTFGRNACWTEYAAVVHQGSYIDSTGKHTPVLNGSPSLVPGLWGGHAYDFTIGTEFISIPSATDLMLNPTAYVQIISDTTDVGSGQPLLYKSSSNGNGYRLFKRPGSPEYRFRYPDLGNLDANTSVFGLARDEFMYDGITQSIHANRNEMTSRAVSGTIVNNSDDVIIGSVNDASVSDTGMNGKLYETWISDTLDYDPNRSDTEHENLFNTANFYGTPVVYEVGGTPSGTEQPVELPAAVETEYVSALTITQTLALFGQVNVEEQEYAEPVGVSQALSAVVNIASESEFVSLLDVSQQQQLATVIAEEIEVAGLAELENIQAMAFIVAEEHEFASPIDVDVTRDQIITVVTASESEYVQLIAVATTQPVNSAVIVEQEVAGPVSLQSLLNVNVLMAEESEFASAINIIQQGAQVSLNDLVLIPVSTQFSLKPVNPVTYTLEQVK